MIGRIFQIGGISGLLVATAVVAWAGSNLNSSKSNTYRLFNDSRFVTATENLAEPSQTVTVFTTPARGDFILTQACISFVNGGMRLAVNEFGPIAHVGEPTCQIFNPGFILPRNAQITCSTTAAADPGDYFCAISAMWDR